MGGGGLRGLVRSAMPRASHLLGLGLLAVLFVAPARGVFENEERTANITRTLDSLLSKTYDKRIRPDIGGVPVKVRTNLLVKSLGPVSENDQMYVMDVYFRQNWYDRRLGFDFPGIDEFSMSWLFLEKIWKPDTYFVNGKKSHLHKMTSPNRFVRLRKDGFLTYSMRLTIAAKCRMHLRKFPLDSQICPLIIGSYGYTQNDVVYEWDESGVGLAPGISDAQYDIVKTTVVNDQTILRGVDKYSVVGAKFYFRRSIGYYVLQIYVPCSLIVCCSWISFWITPSDVAGRTSLAVTTVLSITTLGFGGRAQLPKVSHATALDWFVIICFAFAFAVMIEYAVINFTDRLAADIKKLFEERAAKKAAADKEAEERAALEKSLDVEGQLEDIDAEKKEPERKPYVFLPNRWYSIPSDLSSQALRVDPIWTPVHSVASSKSPVGWYKEKLSALSRFWKEVHFLPRQLDPIAEAKFHKIDMIARRVFPITFSVIIFTYSMLYTYYITDRSEDLENDLFYP